MQVLKAMLPFAAGFSLCIPMNTEAAPPPADTPDAQSTTENTADKAPETTVKEDSKSAQNAADEDSRSLAARKEKAAPADSAPLETEDSVDNGDATETKEASYPRFHLHGNFRITYGEGRINYPQLGTAGKIKAYTVNRRLQLYPSIDFSKEWSLVGMLEDTRYDKDWPTDHGDDNHLYLDRLYLQHQNQHGSELRLGRDNVWPIEGNLFDEIVEGVQYKAGNIEKEGRFGIFAGKAIGKSSRIDKDRKNGIILSYTKKWPKWQTGLYYYGFHRDDSEPEKLNDSDLATVASGGSALPMFQKLLDIQNTIDTQHVGELYLKYFFDKHVSLEFEGMYGHASNKSNNSYSGYGMVNYDDDHWGDMRTGYIFTLRLRQDPDLWKPGDYGLWLSYYNLPRPTYVYPTLDAPVNIFGRAGFKGIGTRLDLVTAPGLLFEIIYYDLYNKDRGPSVLGVNPFSKSSERVLVFLLRQFF